MVSETDLMKASVFDERSMEKTETFDGQVSTAETGEQKTDACSWAIQEIKLIVLRARDNPGGKIDAHSWGYGVGRDHQEVPGPGIRTRLRRLT